MKAKSLEEISEALVLFSETETIEVNLKKLILVYKALEDWRYFFHNNCHYPTIQDIHEYVGNKNTGMYATLNRIYMDIFGEMLPDDIEDKLE